MGQLWSRGAGGKAGTGLKSCPSGGDVEKDEVSYPSLGMTCVRAGAWLLSPAQHPHHHGSALVPCLHSTAWVVGSSPEGEWGSYTQRTAFPLVGVTDESKSCSSLGKITFTFFSPSFVCSFTPEPLGRGVAPADGIAVLPTLVPASGCAHILLSDPKHP